MTTSSSPADVAVVTVSYGSEDVLAPFVDSIAEASVGEVLLVVADNRPGQRQVEEITTAAGGVYIAMPGNLGYGGAMNEVIRRLPDHVTAVLVSNPDVVLHPRSIDLLRARLAMDGHIGSVGPAIYTASGDLYPSARAVPSLRIGIGHALFANLWQSNPWTRAYRNDLTVAAGTRDAGWLSGACLLVRREAFATIGGFDPGYFMYFEDVDLGYRLGRAGYRNVYEPTAEVTHTGAHSTAEDSAAMVEAHHVSAKRFVDNQYSGRVLWPLRVLLRASLTVRSALAKRRLRT